MRSRYRSLTLVQIPSVNPLPGMCLAARAEHSDYSLIKTSLQRGANCVSRRQTALVVSLAAVKKTAKAVTDVCVGVFHPAKAGC